MTLTHARRTSSVKETTFVINFNHVLLMRRRQVMCYQPTFDETQLVSCFQAVAASVCFALRSLDGA